MGVSSAFEVAILAVNRDDTDTAAIELARTYATAIDADPDQLDRYGPKLLACLEQLLMTPKARAAVVKGGTGSANTPTSPLDELRARRRKRDTPPVDPPTTGTDT